ncbi:MAG: Druantia anti-phage system protein DruA [Steroidobacteraceae bacterium]
MRYCGRLFGAADLEVIRELLTACPPLSRYRLSRNLCERLDWRRPDGTLKDMSCRVALLRMQKDALITLPPPRRPKPVAYRSHPDIEQAVGEPVSVPRIDLTRLSVDLVTEKRDSLLWNAYIERHHYLRYQLVPGAQLRYFVRAADQVVTLMSFGASAWKAKPRDALIGCNRRLADDWQARYAYRPVLLETFVEKPRFTGTCYKAANWQHLGDTQGRGKLDTLHRRNKPIKSVWVYPDFRRHLCTA